MEGQYQTLWLWSGLESRSWPPRVWCSQTLLREQVEVFLLHVGSGEEEASWGCLPSPRHTHLYFLCWAHGCEICITVEEHVSAQSLRKGTADIGV